MALGLFNNGLFGNGLFAAGLFNNTAGSVLPDPCAPDYTPTLDFSQDYLVWDNIQTVDHTSVRTSGDVVTCILGHRHNIDRRELAASNGVYTPDDLIWRLPKPTCPIRPKPRDLITDAEGRTVTMLQVSYIVDQQRYRCVCRDLILANDLYDTIDVETPTITYTTAGAKVKTWEALYSDIPARLQPITADLVDERGMRGLRVTHELIVGQALVVTNEDRVVLDGVYYEIRGYHNPERIDELPVLDVELVP